MKPILKHKINLIFMNGSKNILKEKSFALALRIIKLYKFLVDNKKEYVLSKQVLRSGTSVGAMIREAQNAESKMDFVHKLAIAQKECDESLYWLELLVQSDYITDESFKSVYGETEQVFKMIKSAILTIKKNLQANKNNQ
jgi:four helix bundle protein